MKGVGVTDPKQTFTHISVNDGADDDIVIQAGAPKKASKAAQTLAEEHLAKDASLEDSVAYLDEVAQVAVSNEDDEALDEEEAFEDDDFEYDEDEAVIDAQGADDEAAVPDGQVAETTRKKADTYHETTLEDLQDTSMSSTQKVVIGVVLVILVVAIIYFAFFMK